MVYSYDLKTNGQRVIRRTLLDDRAIGRFYVANWREDVLPPHRFPCLPCSHKAKTSRITYRINNRLSLIHENQDAYANVLYFQYYHSPQVELDKMQFDLQKTIFKLLEMK